jgi:hypothetical protein
MNMGFSSAAGSRPAAMGRECTLGVAQAKKKPARSFLHGRQRGSPSACASLAERMFAPGAGSGLDELGLRRTIFRPLREERGEPDFGEGTTQWPTQIPTSRVTTYIMNCMASEDIPTLLSNRIQAVRNAIRL